MKILLVTTALFVFSIASEAQEQAEKPPIAVWKFEEGEGVQVNDSSGNMNNGKISNEVKRLPEKTGTALKFILQDKKNGCVIIPEISKKYNNFTAGITLEAWIKLNRSSKRAATYEIISNTESDRGRGFRFLITWGTLAFRSGEGGNGKTWGAASKPSELQIKPDIWYHVAAVYDGSVFKVYLDGELVGKSDKGLSLTPGDKNIYIGSYRGGYAYGFDGMIDEVKIYDYPRSDVQILNDAKKEH